MLHITSLVYPTSVTHTHMHCLKSKLYNETIPLKTEFSYQYKLCYICYNIAQCQLRKFHTIRLAKSRTA